MRATSATLAFGKSWEPFILNRGFPKNIWFLWTCCVLSCTSPHVQLHIFISTISNIHASSLAVHSRTKQAFLGHGAQHGHFPSFSHFSNFSPWVSKTALRSVTYCDTGIQLHPAGHSACPGHHSDCHDSNDFDNDNVHSNHYSHNSASWIAHNHVQSRVVRYHFAKSSWYCTCLDQYWYFMFAYVCMLECWSVPWLPCQGSQYGFCQNHNCPSCREIVMNLMALRQCFEMLWAYSNCTLFVWSMLKVLCLFVTIKSLTRQR